MCRVSFPDNQTLPLNYFFVVVLSLPKNYAALILASQ